MDNLTLSHLRQNYDLDFTEANPINIPNVGRLDLVRWIRELDFRTGAEVGVDQAYFSRLICELNPQLKLYGIDPYLKYPEYREYKDQRHLDNTMAIARGTLRYFVARQRYEFIRKTSMDALKDFEDDSLDFCYIDANHEGDFPYEDIKGWYAKVRPGGILAGHDYVRSAHVECTVKDALERFTKEENIDPWFVLGLYSMRPRLIRDRTRSWMIIK